MTHAELTKKVTELLEDVAIAGQYDNSPSKEDVEYVIEVIRTYEQKRIRESLTDPVMFNQGFIDSVTNAFDSLGIDGEDTQTAP